MSGYPLNLSLLRSWADDKSPKRSPAHIATSTGDLTSRALIFFIACTNVPGIFESGWINSEVGSSGDITLAVVALWQGGLSIGNKVLWLPGGVIVPESDLSPRANRLSLIIYIFFGVSTGPCPLPTDSSCCLFPTEFDQRVTTAVSKDDSGVRGRSKMTSHHQSSSVDSSLELISSLVLLLLSIVSFSRKSIILLPLTFLTARLLAVL